ncbi:MAG: tetratricopeptide repeat protein [Flavobacteriales bacterium]
MKPSNITHKIFGKKPIPDEQQIRNYLSGKLTGKDAAEFEQTIQNDPFLAEAIEGFEQNPNALSAFLKNKTQQANNFSKRKGGINPIYYAIAGITVVITLSVFLNKYTFTSTKNELLSKSEIEILKEKTSIESLTEEEIEESTLIEEDRQIKTEEVIKSPIKLKADPTISQPTFESLIRVEITTLPIINEIQNPITSAQPVERKNVVFHNAPTVYLHDLLVVDYSKIYTESIPVNKFELSGTPAYKANEQDKNELSPSGLNTTYVPYKEYLLGAMQKFRTNKLKAALKDYQVILKQYPDDINAMFYGGLCYYNINHSDKALEMFNRVIQHNYNTFEEEAKWYKAQALLELKRKEEAKSILEEIIASDGFYTKQAKQLHKKL